MNRFKPLCALTLSALTIILTVFNSWAHRELDRVEADMADMRAVLAEMSEQPPAPRVERPYIEHMTYIEPAEPQMVYLGEFKSYAYCSCRRCCGKWADGITATGTKATQGRTVAVDKTVIPLGSVIYIPGIGERIAEDTGVSGKAIDLYMDSHAEAEQFGVQTIEVYILK